VARPHAWTEWAVSVARPLLLPLLFGLLISVLLLLLLLKLLWKENVTSSPTVL
jgi:hypothetical protein